MEGVAHDVDGRVLPFDKRSVPPDFMLGHALNLDGSPPSGEGLSYGRDTIVQCPGVEQHAPPLDQVPSSHHDQCRRSAAQRGRKHNDQSQSKDGSHINTHSQPASFGKSTAKAGKRLSTLPAERGRSPPAARRSVEVVWTFLSLFTSYAAADRAFAAPKWLRPRRRDGPRSGGVAFKMLP